ncbi:MAG: PilN domain-containing protein [Thermodesulfobacteriota bacterium]
MIRINLLPYRRARKKENIRKQISVYFLSIILIMLILFVFDFSVKSKIDNLNTKIKSAQSELARYQKQAKEVDALKSELSKLDSKIKVIDSLKDGRNFGINILKELTILTVAERMWLTSANIKRDSVNFNGFALDDKTVADFMRNLEKSQYFFDIDLKNVTKADMKNTEVRKFIINSKVEAENISGE